MARARVGEYTGWLMRTDRNAMRAVYYAVPPGRVTLIIPGPPRVASLPIAREFDSRIQIGLQGQQVARLSLTLSGRLPYDWLYTRGVILNRARETVTDVQIDYVQSWADYESGGVALTGLWPSELGLIIYRVAATMYLYREATVMGDRPLQQILRSSLDTYLPVTL